MTLPIRNVFESSLFIKGKLGLWKQYYAILSPEASICFYKSRDGINEQPLVYINLSNATTTFGTSSRVNKIKFNIKTAKKIYQLATSNCTITNAWIKHLTDAKKKLNDSKWGTQTAKSFISGFLFCGKSADKKTWKQQQCALTYKTFTSYNEKGKANKIKLCDIKIIKLIKEINPNSNAMITDTSSMEFRTEKQIYKYYCPGSLKWKDWTDTFSNIIDTDDCTSCNHKNNGYCNFKPSFEGILGRSVLKNKKKSSKDRYCYVIDDRLKCLVGVEHDYCLKDLKTMLIRNDYYDSFVLNQFKKNCKDFVDMNIKHDISFVGPFIIIDGIIYETTSDEEMNKWRQWIEVMQTGIGLRDKQKDLCVVHLFLLVDGYCTLNKFKHFPYDICRMLLHFI